MQCRLNALFLATVAVYLSAGLSPARAAKADARPAAAEEPVKTVKGKQVTLEFRESDFKLLKSQAEFLAFLDSVYATMQELTYASPPMILRCHKNLGAWGTAGLDGVRIDWTCVPGFMTGFNTGMIEFGVVHEIGHVFDARNFPRWYITPGCGGETFGNIKLSYALEMLLRKDNAYRIEFGPGGKQTGYDFNNNFYLPAGKKYLASDTPWEKLGVDELHAFHMTLIRKYGWDVYKKWFRAYYLIEAQKDGRAPPSCNDPVRINLVCALLSAFSGDNLVADFQQWRMPVTEASVNEVRKRYQLSDVCPAVEKQFAKEYAEGKITLDPLSLRVTAEPVANKTMSAIGFFSAVKIDGAVVRYTLDNSEVGSLFTKSYQGTPVTVNKPVTVNAALFVPGKSEPLLRASLNVTPASPAFSKPAATAAVAAASLAEIYERDTPFNGGTITSAAPGALDPADTHPGLNLIPWPKSIEVKPGQMKLTAASRIVAADACLKALADILSEEVSLLTGLKLAVAGGSPRAGDIVLKFNSVVRADEPILMARPPELVRTTDGAHALAIGDQAVVEGFDYRAVAEGTATLLQALSQSNGQVALPKLVIKDWPHADYCAMMIDCGRQEQPIEWLKKMIETCRLYKVRYVHLHLTDDQGWCFPSATYPQLGSKNHGTHGGLAPKVYPLEELKGLVAYADARGIALVPELEVPGHSGAALRSLPEIFDAINPETQQPVGMGCMNMASEAIYPALDTIIFEMCAVFKSSPYFHIGSDEVSMGRVSLAPGYKAFMEKHGLKNDGELANYFIARVNDLVKKHGKKAIKWEGLANTAAKDIIIMTWDSNSNMASKLIAQGHATITCPWTLGVPWEQWSMYVCNGSLLKKGDPVIGATLVAWEQSAEVHAGMARNVASRQERTWGPDNSVTEAGFAARFQAQDAAAGKLIGLSPKPVIDAAFVASAGTRDLLQPVFAGDGKDATFYASARPPKAGDAFTVELAKPALVYAIEVLTGINGKGLVDGAELQVSADGTTYVTVAKLAKGTAKAILSDNAVKAVRLRCGTPQSDPMVVREIKLQQMVEMSGTVSGPGKTLGAGNIGVLKGDTTFHGSSAACLNPVINRGFTLAFNSGGGNAGGYNGPISGTGTVQIFQGGSAGGFRDSPLVLGGKEPNTMTGTWQVKCGRLTLAKVPGTDAAGGTIIVGGQGDNDCLCWANNDQLNDASSVELLDSPKGGATLNLNGCSETFASLKMAPHTKIVTHGAKAGGVLTVGALTVDGTRIPKGAYTSAEPWITGSGFVVVGAVKSVGAAGVIDNANAAIGVGNIAVLTNAATFGPATGSCGIPVRTGDFGLTFCAAGDKTVAYSGFITGSGSVTFNAAVSGLPAARHPLDITGPAANTYSGPTVLSCGVLKLSKPSGVIAIPGNLSVGGSGKANAGDGVILADDGQIAPSATVTLNGKAQPCFLDLSGHKAALAKVVVDGQAKLRTGAGGLLTVKQLIVDGKKVTAGTHKAPQAWLEGNGSVTVDPHVDVKGRYSNPNGQIGSGNIGNMIGDTEFSVGVGTCDIDLITNGHTLTFDSGGGNALCYLGSISGTGDVVLLMGPSRTSFKDAPLRLASDKPNMTTGKFIARKGRVQLEKPDGTDAISGDVIVGGQGFNDCLHWLNSNQIKDSASITVLSAGNNGAAYLSLNGCSETAAALVMASGTAVKTDSPEGQGGVLTVKSLTVNDAKKSAGTYTAATEKWIEGKGKVIVTP